MVLAESWYPGWRAEVDGVASELYRANVLQRAVYVESGAHRVVVSYRPSFFALALLLTLVGALLLAVLLLADRRRDH